MAEERIRLGKQMEKDGEKVPQLKSSSGFARSYLVDHIGPFNFIQQRRADHTKLQRSTSEDMPVDEVRSWFDKNEVTCSGRGPGDSRLCGGSLRLWLQLPLISGWLRCELVVNGRL